MSTNVFNILNDEIFSMDFQLDTPITIKNKDNLYLTFVHEKNIKIE